MEDRPIHSDEEEESADDESEFPRRPWTKAVRGLMHRNKKFLYLNIFAGGRAHSQVSVRIWDSKMVSCCSKSARAKWETVS